MTPRIEITETPAEADRAAIHGGLLGHNTAAYGRLNEGTRWIIARDAAGGVAGGARCDIASGWLYLDWLWVAAPARGSGLGARLLLAAETLARERRLLGVHLYTFSFQAPGFYRKQGYAEFARMDDMPPGATRFWFVKRF
ncbi:MAG TPA: GNAT family N-acetyltransferase [Roseomonas sp.]